MRLCSHFLFKLGFELAGFFYREAKINNSILLVVVVILI